MTPIQILALIGFLLSAYALYVKYRFSRKPYKPLCDISSRISCTKAFRSKYSVFSDLPTSLFGIVFYASVFLLAAQKELIFYLAIAALAVTIYLAYISYFKQKNFCLVCSAIYLINILLLIFSL